MTLGLALNSALTGLDASQQSLAVLSNNISNANTVGYSRQKIEQSALIIAGRGAGVASNEIARIVDNFFQDSTRLQSTTVQNSAVVSEYYKRIQLFFGQPEQGNSLDSSINNFFDALTSLSTSPDQTFFQTDAVTKGVGLANKLSGLAENLEKTRFDVDQDIKKAVDDINAALSELGTVNSAIQQATALGQSMAPLYDRRDMALANIAQFLDINVTYTVDGQANIGTPSGIELLGNSQYVLSYSPAGSQNTFINRDILNSLDVLVKRSDGTIIDSPKQTLATSAVSGSIVSNIRNGKLKGLMDLRDDHIPKIIEQLDQLATVLRNQMNIIHNDGSSFPPRNTLLGTTAIAPNDIRAFGGSVRIAVLGQDGLPPTSPYPNETFLPPLTIKLNELDSGQGFGQPSMQTIVNEINYYYGPQQKRIALGNLNDIKLAARTDTIANGSNFTFDFDLANYSKNGATVDVTGLTVSGGSTVVSGLPFSAIIAAGDKGRTAPAGNEFTVNLAGGGPTWTVSATVQVTDNVTGDIRTDTINWTITAAASGVRNQRYVSPDTTFAGDGAAINPTSIATIASAAIVTANGTVATGNQPGVLRLAATRSTFGIALDELSSVENGIPNASPTTQALTATGRGFSGYFGLNDFFITNNDNIENSAYNLEVRADIVKTPGLISTGELVATRPPADPDAVPSYTYELGKAGNQIAKRMADLQAARVTFAGTSSLPKMTLSLANYGGEIVGYLTSKTNNAEIAASQDKLIGEGLDQRLESSRGVNIDEEMANALQFENAYKANSRIISVVGELLDALLEVA